MFEQSLFVSQGTRLTTAARWTWAGSVTLQCVVAALLITIPLFHPERILFRTTAPLVFVQVPGDTGSDGNFSNRGVVGADAAASGELAGCRTRDGGAACHSARRRCRGSASDESDWRPGRHERASAYGPGRGGFGNTRLGGPRVLEQERARRCGSLRVWVRGC